MSNSFKNRIRNCEMVCGTHVAMSDTTAVEIMGSIGYDFLWIDTEHTDLSYSCLLQHLRTARMAGTPALVRTEINNRNHTKKILEMGPDGIIFPMINTPEEAEEAMDMCLYPPLGHRGFGPLRAIDYGLRDMDDYLTHINDELCRFVQIETTEAINNLPAIVKNPYIDGYIFGPCDLSGSLGKLGQLEDPDFLILMKKAIEILQNAGKSIGISFGMITDSHLPVTWSEMGINMISTSGDYSYILSGAVRNLEYLHEARKIGKSTR